MDDITYRTYNRYTRNNDNKCMKLEGIYEL